MLTSSCRGLLCESFLSRATIQEKFTRSLLHETITRRFNSTDKPLTSRWPEEKKKGHLEPKKSSRGCKLSLPSLLLKSCSWLIYGWASEGAIAWKPPELGVFQDMLQRQ